MSISICFPSSGIKILFNLTDFEKRTSELTEVAPDEGRRCHVLESNDLHFRVLVLQLRKIPENEVLCSAMMIAVVVVIYADDLDVILQNYTTSFQILQCPADRRFAFLWVRGILVLMYKSVKTVASVATKAFQAPRVLTNTELTMNGMISGDFQYLVWNFCRIYFHVKIATCYCARVTSSGKNRKLSETYNSNKSCDRNIKF